jgi:hypothetical protein
MPVVMTGIDTQHLFELAARRVGKLGRGRFAGNSCSGTTGRQTRLGGWLVLSTAPLQHVPPADAGGPAATERAKAHAVLDRLAQSDVLDLIQSQPEL